MDSIIPEMLMKQCAGCGIEYPATDAFWHKHKLGKYGLRSECKSCRSERGRQYREANPETVRESRRKYREANPEKVRECRMKWQQSHVEYHRVATINYRARKRNAEGSHTAAELQEQYKRQKGRCYYCGQKLPKRGWHADHAVPLIKGGNNSIDNIVCTCPECNFSKNDKLPHEWDGTDRLL